MTTLAGGPLDGVEVNGVPGRLAGLALTYVDEQGCVQTGAMIDPAADHVVVLWMLRTAIDATIEGLGVDPSQLAILDAEAAAHGGPVETWSARPKGT